MKNAIFVIRPYKWNGMWVFDDERVGRVRRPEMFGRDCLVVVVRETGKDGEGRWSPWEADEKTGGGRGPAARVGEPKRIG